MEPQIDEVKKAVIEEFETLQGNHFGAISRQFLEQYFKEHISSPTLKWCVDCRKDITDKAISFWRAEDRHPSGLNNGVKVTVGGVECIAKPSKHPVRDYHLHPECLDKRYKFERKPTDGLMQYIDSLIEVEFGNYDTFKAMNTKEPWAMRGKCCVCDNGEGEIMHFGRIVDDGKGYNKIFSLEYNEDVHGGLPTEVNEGEPSLYSHYFHKKCFMDLFKGVILE